MTGLYRGEPRRFIHGHHLRRKDTHPRWNGGTQIDRIPELTECERCGQPAVDRHHVDGDHFNHAPGNVIQLCRRCHMEIDGRLDAFRDHPAAQAERLKPPPWTSR